MVNKTRTDNFEDWSGEQARSEARKKTGSTGRPVVQPTDSAPRQSIYSPDIVRMSDVQPEAITWLWPNRIPVGKQTIFVGDPGIGKTFLTLDISARVSTGAGWPDNLHARSSPGGVILLSAEDDPADTLRPRLDAAGADVSRISFLRAVKERNPDTGEDRSTPFTLSHDIEQLKAAIVSVPDCKLVIIDPISAYLGGGPRFDSHNNSDVRAVLAPLSELAAKIRVAVVTVTHLRKGEGPAMYRAMGSLAFVAAARAVWYVCKDKDDESGRRRLILPGKINIAPEATGLAYTLQPEGDTAVVAWSEDPVVTSADDALSATVKKPGPEAEELEAATIWLRSALANGPRPATELTDEAVHGELISKRTLDRARKALRVRPFRPVVPGAWWWEMQGCQVPPRDTPHKQLGYLGNLAVLEQKRGFPEGDLQGCQVPEALGEDADFEANKARVIDIERAHDGGTNNGR